MFYLLLWILIAHLFQWFSFCDLMVAFLVFGIYANWAHFAFLMNFFVLHFCFNFLLEFLMFYLLLSILIAHLFQWFSFSNWMVAFLLFAIYANWAHLAFLMNFFRFAFLFEFSFGVSNVLLAIVYLNCAFVSVIFIFWLNGRIFGIWDLCKLSTFGILDEFFRFSFLF